MCVNLFFQSKQIQKFQTQKFPTARLKFHTQMFQRAWQKLMKIQLFDNRTNIAPFNVDVLNWIIIDQ